MSSGDARQNLGIQRIESVDFVVHDIERSRGFYEQKMDFRRVAQGNDAYAEQTGEQTYVFDAAKARVQVTAPAPAARFRSFSARRHQASTARRARASSTCSSTSAARIR